VATITNKGITMTTITTIVPAAVQAPRAAPLAAKLFGALLRTFQSKREAHVAKSAQAHRTAEAAALREYAIRQRPYNPSLADDLLAAADRHEIQV
jgi:hypothetical protein